MTVCSIEVCFATSSWQLAAVSVYSQCQDLFCCSITHVLGTHEFLFLKLLFLSYLKQTVFMPIVHVHDCNCELQEPFTVFMQAWFGQYRRPCRLYMCIPSGNRVPDLLKTNSGAAMVPAYSTFWIRFHVWNSFFCAIRTGIGPVQKAI